MLEQWVPQPPKLLFCNIIDDTFHSSLADHLLRKLSYILTTLPPSALCRRPLSRRWCWLYKDRESKSVEDTEKEKILRRGHI